MLKDVTKCYLHFFKYPTSRVCSPGDYVGFYVRAEQVVSLYMSPYGGQGIMLHQTFFQLWIASRVGEDRHLEGFNIIILQCFDYLLGPKT